VKLFSASCVFIYLIFLNQNYILGQTVPELVDVKMIWNNAAHNAFTDLIRFNDKWYLSLREGSEHASFDGRIRIIASRDGNNWISVALISDTLADLRDPKLTFAPDSQLMLNSVAASENRTVHQSLVWFSSNGTEWNNAVEIGEINMWLWRSTVYNDTAFTVGYYTAAADNFVRLYYSTDMISYASLVDTLFNLNRPSEGSLIFLDDSTSLCLLRLDYNTSNALCGVARSPYTDWEWYDIGVRLGGPNMILLRDGRIIVAGRLYDNRTRTSLLWLDLDDFSVSEFLELPSGGDTGYPGLVFFHDTLWVSYYSSHEGKASIYLAKVKLYSEVLTVEPNLPKIDKVFQNYPNPFNPFTTIRYSIEQPGFVRLTVYDELGRLVRALVHEKKPAGEYAVVWNGKNENGQLVSSGTYFYRLRVPGNTLISKQMILIK